MNLKIDDNIFDNLLLQANESPRKRSHKNIHQDLEEPVQRLCIALKKGTYVRPHYHPQSNKWELMLVLRGAVTLVIFEEDGTIIERVDLKTGSSICGIELEPGTWHTIFPITDEAVILEVKEGPFTPSKKADFATWAPEEDETGVNHFLNWLECAAIGENYNANSNGLKQ